MQVPENLAQTSVRKKQNKKGEENLLDLVAEKPQRRADSDVAGCSAKIQQQKLSSSCSTWQDVCRIQRESAFLVAEWSHVPVPESDGV